MKRFFACFLVVVFLLPSFVLLSFAVEEKQTIPATSAILMDVDTGKILFEQNAEEALPPASVTKIMSLLLIMEAVEDGVITLEDMVCVSDYASKMGGSQVFLKAGEEMKAEDLLKSVIIASANDATVALAEHIAGSEEEFVTRMNKRAEELGMVNTHFENTNGLDDTTENHLTSAKDIAIMSKELLKHEKIMEYSTIWMDSIRDGEFVLTNTNRLVRFYQGCTGLKTGSTSKAKFCMSASAERNGLHLVAVIMGADTRDIRNAQAAKLLDYGFANFASYKDEATPLSPLKVTGGVLHEVGVHYDGFAHICEKGKEGKIEKTINLPESIKAPIVKGDVLGHVIYAVDGEKVGETPILADENVEKISFGEVFCRMLQFFASC